MNSIFSEASNVFSKVGNVLSTAMDRVISSKENKYLTQVDVECVKENENIPDPFYCHDGDAGFDLYSVEPTFILEPYSRKKVDTGVKFALPPGVELQIRPKSGRSDKEGLTVLNSPGTCDSNFRANYMVLLFNSSDSPIEIQQYKKIAQAVPSFVPRLNFKMVENLSSTSRGEGGFGSTGL